MPIEINDPVKGVCDGIYELTGDYLTVLADDSSDSMGVVDMHARLCNFLQGQEFRNFRTSIGNLIGLSGAESIYANWLEIGILRDQVLFAQNPHRNKDQVTLLVGALRSRIEVVRENDIPFIESAFAQ